MAKGPGPLIALAGLAALFLMSRKGDDGAPEPTVDSSDKDAIDNADDGDVVGDDSPGGGAQSGGTKVPSGTGTGGGGWKKPVSHSPELAWISPDCQAVHEPQGWYDDVFVPKAKEFIAAVDATGASSGKFPHEANYGGVEVSTYLNPFDPLALVLGIKKLASEGTPSGTVVFNDAAFMDTYPWACLKTFPGFELTTKYFGLDPELTEESAGTVSAGEIQAKISQFHSDMLAWAQDFPDLALWLQSFYTRFVWDRRFGMPVRSTPTAVYPGALWADILSDVPAWILTTVAGPPDMPEPPSFFDLQDEDLAAAWIAAAGAWAAQHRDDYPWVRGWYAAISDWYDSQSRGGTQAPVPSGVDIVDYTEMAPGGPVSTGMLYGRVLGYGGKPVPNVEVSSPADGVKTMTSSNGYFEVPLPFGWTGLEFRKGVHRWGEQVQVEPWASPFVEVVNSQIQPSTSSGIVSGQVVGALDAPVAGVTAWSEFGSALTDSNGMFELEMASGQQQLELTYGPLIWLADVNVRANQSISVVIKNPDLGSGS